MVLTNKFAMWCFSMIALAAAPVLAQEAKLPQGKEVLTRYFQVLGGEAKLAQVKSSEFLGKVTFRGAGIQGNMKVAIAEGGKFRQVMELEGVGTESSGSDGTTVWATSAVTGARLVEGIEAEQAKLANGHPVPQIGYGKYFESIECTGVEKFDGVDCYVVKYVKADRKPMIDYFEKSTGLLRGTRQTMVTNQGNVEVQMTMSNYRDVEGIKYPFTSVMSLGPGLVMEVQLTSFSANAKLEPNQFELPADVAALKE